MKKIITSASTSNLGPGFDCLGLALSIFNTFTIEKTNTTTLLNVAEEYNNEDNLFLKAYRYGCAYLQKEVPIQVDFHTEVPIARGLGSSSTFIVGGITAAFLQNNLPLDKECIFQLASQMEGHPDNAAPCVYGGFSASITLDDGSFHTEQLALNDQYQFTCFIPDFEVSTEEARKILPDVYLRHIAVRNSAKAILVTKALESGDLSLLQQCATDEIHEPYRKSLIPGFDQLKAISEKDTAGVFLISGSGSTCILIHKDSLSLEAQNHIQNLDGHWQIRNLKPYHEGLIVEDGV